MEGGREAQEGGDIPILWLIHVDIWQKETQYYKAIILQLKINKSKFKKRTRSEVVKKFYFTLVTP